MREEEREVREEEREGERIDGQELVLRISSFAFYDSLVSGGLLNFSDLSHSRYRWWLGSERCPLSIPLSLSFSFSPISLSLSNSLSRPYVLSLSLSLSLPYHAFACSKSSHVLREECNDRNRLDVRPTQ